MPLLGDSFPTMNVQTTHGMMELPKQFKGKWFVLFSHPADFTPVCTTEFVAFQKRYEKFNALNCELIGLSVDQVFAHIKWEECIKEKLGVEIQFPIIADNGMVAETLGLIHPGKGTNTVRAVFVVDAMQIADKYSVAMHANWPSNELVHDHVIVPPAKDTKTAKERLEKAKAGEFECYDWWLCHKKLKK